MDNFDIIFSTYGDYYDSVIIDISTDDWITIGYVVTHIKDGLEFHKQCVQDYIKEWEI
jgi:hypothetical protein